MEVEKMALEVKYWKEKREGKQDRKGNKIMKVKQAPAPRKTGNQIVEEKVRDMNEFLKKVDMNQLQETIEKAWANTPK